MKKFMLILLIGIMLISCGSKEKTEETAVNGSSIQQTKNKKADKKLSDEIQKVLENYNYTYNNETKEYNLELIQADYDKFNPETFKIKEIKFSENNGLKEYNINDNFKVLIKNSDYKRIKGADGKHRLAIVIDDVGYYGPEIAEKYNSLGFVMTFAVLPKVQHNREGREILEKAGHEIILHLPMESTSKSLNKNTPGLLTVNMTKEQMKKSIIESLDDVGGAKGFNNHIGSIFTGNQTAVSNLVSVAKELNLFYLDSNVIPHSKGFPTAKEKGVKTALNHFFVDNKADVEYIKSYIKQGVDIAKTRDETVIIGHYRPKTVEAFIEMKQYIKDSGVELVTLSDVLE